MSLIVLPPDFPRYSPYLGAKITNLNRLAALGLPVPRFAAVPATAVTSLFRADKTIDSERVAALAAEASTAIPASRYAVRSSALLEDGVHSSMAGRFKTKLNVAKSEIAVAIIEVLNHAAAILPESLDRFSLIIQEYIDVDYAGVVFTRNPAGGREMILEYTIGPGERTVGGKVRPDRIRYFWPESPPKSVLPNLGQAISVFKQVEYHFELPQDIEWCVKKGKWFYLQSRPITSYTENNYRDAKFLDDRLPKNVPFRYEKTAIAEAAPRPVPITLDLLRRIYRNAGPAAKVYQQYDISYEADDFFAIVGNELYVDRRKEIKTLFPAFDYLIKPKWSSFKGSLRTLSNQYKFRHLPVSRYRMLDESIRKLFDSSFEQINLQKSIEAFDRDYALVFEVNLLAEKTNKQLETALKGSGMTAADAFAARAEFLPEASAVNPNFSNFVGNSIDLADESPFVLNRQSVQASAKFTDWYKRLPSRRQRFLRPILTAALFCESLREMGRWLAIKRVTDIRKVLFGLALEKYNFTDKRLIYFTTFKELEDGEVKETECQQRKNSFLQYNQFSFPSILTNQGTKVEDETIGVSSGVAGGVLVQEKQLESTGDKPILYTPMLLPELAKYFDRISGVVSERGGMLSHLAIIARERSLPMVVGFDLNSSGISLGDTVSINGSTGEVKKA